jgi:ketosteroid isomerase-like protein
MRLILLLATIAFLACNSENQARKADEAEILRLNNQYDSALLKGDTGFLKKLYSDDFMYTSPEGKFLTKDQQITGVAISEIKWVNVKSDDVKLNLYGDFAVMTGVFTANGTLRGNPISFHERYTCAWRKNDKRWQMVAEQGTVVTP